MSSSPTPNFSPLLVRSPNLNGWLPNTHDDGEWLKYWTQNAEGHEYSLGLGGMIRIDGVTESWIGKPIGGKTGFVEQTMTPTSTIRKFSMGGVDLDVTFLSPIEPEDVVRQSFPFSYISIDVRSNDGQPHRVQIYLDMQGQWLSFESSTVLNTFSVVRENIMFLQAAPVDLATTPLKVVKRRPEDVTLYYGMPTGLTSTYQIGPEIATRTGFASHGRLNNTGAEAANQAIFNGTDLFSLSLSKDLGNVTSSTVSNALFAIGLVRDPSISFVPSPGGTPELRSPCFRAAFGSVGPGLEDFIMDFSAARDRAAAFDEQVTKAARGVSDDVADLVALTTRTVMASMDVTCGSNMDDVMFFVNAMGSRHEIPREQRDDARYSNRVEDLYASWPAIMFINATYGKYMLEPLLRFQANGTQAYALPDLGHSYPKVDGGEPDSDTAKYLGVEESSNMILMSWAQARFSGESDMVNKYYGVLKRWAEYLPDNIPVPGSKAFTNSADGVASANTNLALKGILGIRAMAELAAIKGEITASQDYFNRSRELYHTWRNATFSGHHLLLDYGDNESWGLMYNMYADKWLGLHLVDDDVYKQQDKWYQSQGAWAPAGARYDSHKEEVKTHWTAFTAGTVEDVSLRNELMRTVHTYAFDRDTSIIQNTFSLTNGKPGDMLGALSSTYGSMFAIQARNLAAQRQVQLNTSESDSNGTREPGNLTHKSTNAGAIAGGVIGGVGAVVLTTFIFLCWWGRHNKQRRLELSQALDVELSTPAVTPFPLKQDGADTPPTSRLEPQRRAQIENTCLVTPFPLEQNGATMLSMSHPEPHSRVAGPALRLQIDQLRNEVRRMRSNYGPPPQYE